MNWTEETSIHAKPPIRISEVLGNGYAGGGMRVCNVLLSLSPSLPGQAALTMSENCYKCCTDFKIRDVSLLRTTQARAVD